MASPWRIEPAWEEAAFVVLLASGYALAVLRLGAPRVRVAAFSVGMLLATAAVVSPIATVGEHYLVAGHLLQNVMLAEWAPALAVLGVPAPLARRIARLPGIATLTRPVVALPLWILTYAVWHLPVAYDTALRHPPLLRLEHLTYFAAGCVLWWCVFHDLPHRVPNGGRAAYLFAAFLFASPLGLLLALLPDAIYSFYAGAPRLWGLDRLSDQEVGGVIMAGSEAIVFFGVFAVFVTRWLADEEAVTPGRAAGPRSR